MTNDQQAVIEAFRRVAAQWAVGGDRRAQRVIENLVPAVIRELEATPPEPDHMSATIPSDASAELARVVDEMRGMIADCDKLNALNPTWPISQERLRRWEAALSSHGGGGEAVAWLHEVVGDDGEPDQALSFAPDNFPLQGVAGYRSVSHRPLIYGDTTPQPRAEGMVLVPSHYAQNVLYAAAIMEQSTSVIDRREGAVLRTFGNLLAAAPGEGSASQSASEFTPTGLPQECDTMADAALLAERVLWQDDEGVRWVPEASWQRALTEIQSLETKLYFPASQSATPLGGNVRCSYPDCNCPFDAPPDPEWCARGLPKSIDWKASYETAQREIADLQRRLDAAVLAQDWQPIDSAPKDGTIVVTNFHGTDVRINCFNSHDDVAPGFRLAAEGWWYSAANRQPTHWLRIPPLSSDPRGRTPEG